MCCSFSSVRHLLLSFRDVPTCCAMHVPFNEIHVLNTHKLFELHHHGYPLVRSLRIRKADVIGILVDVNKMNA